MMLDAFLRGFAILSTIVATLRAGSRGIYISKHGAIGLVDGPRIAAPCGGAANANANAVAAASDNASSSVADSDGNENDHETNTEGKTDGHPGNDDAPPYNPALYELAQNFKRCVEISSVERLSSGSSSGGGFENVVSDCPVVVSADPQKPPAVVAAARAPLLAKTGGLRKLRKRLWSLLDEQMSKQAREDRKDPFGERPYTLGYAHYAPKTFSKSGAASSSSSSSAVGATTAAAGSERTRAGTLAAAAMRSATKGRFFSDDRSSPAGSGCHENDDAADPWSSSSSSWSSWDYGSATEADFFYHAVTPGSSSSNNNNNNNNKTTKKRKRLAQLKAYCPRVFADLRSSVFGVSEEEYARSVLGRDNLVSFQSNSKGAARAGGIFFFTSDGAYMIKTIPDREKNSFLGMLPEYHKHMKRYGRSSLLTRFCGMYGIKIEEEDEDTEEEGGCDQKTENDVVGIRPPEGTDRSGSSSSFAPTGKEYTFVVMNAVFPAEANRFVSERFDLKGSTVGREVSGEELESKGSMAVLKDLDLSREFGRFGNNHRGPRIEAPASSRSRWNRRRRKNKSNNPWSSSGADQGGFTIGATLKAALLSQLRKDVRFLTKCRVMDYSLLVGVVHTGAGRESGVITREVVETIKEQDRILERLEGPRPAAAAAAAAARTPRAPGGKPKLDSALLYKLTTPARLLLSPPLFVARKTWNALRLTIGTVATAPMPYYGSGRCVVHGGNLSVIHGKRRGERAMYYLGLIDFLQPWTTRKVLERRLKGLAGYDTDAISAVTPEEYAARFLEFLDRHIQ